MVNQLYSILTQCNDITELAQKKEFDTFASQILNAPIAGAKQNRYSGFG